MVLFIGVVIDLYKLIIVDCFFKNDVTSLYVALPSVETG